MTDPWASARRAMANLAMLLACLLPALQALAWNSNGHRIVAQIAARELGPQARTRIEQLFAQAAQEVLIGQALWADTITATRPETRPWHYVNIPRRAEGFDRLRDCADGACLIGALETQWARLRDAGESDDSRREALAFVVHLVADLHQPLHCGDGQDRGGNDIAVEVQGLRTNLHRVWDGDFFPWHELAPTGGEPAVPVSDQEDAFEPAVITRWAEDGHRLAVEQIYQGLPKARGDGSIGLDDARLRVYWELARLQVVTAGRRLARLLDAAFGAH